MPNILPAGLPHPTLPGEPTFMVNWQLPLGVSGQVFLFRRIFRDFQRDAGMLEPNLRRQYRKTGEQLQRLRAIAAFWQQVSDFCETYMDPLAFKKLSTDLSTSDRLDGQILELIDKTPEPFAISQLSKQQRQHTAAALEEPRGTRAGGCGSRGSQAAQ